MVVVDVMVFFTAVYAYVSLLVRPRRGAKNEKVLVEYIVP